MEQLKKEIEALSTEEVHRMLHELRVNQIGLEMQNFALQRVQEELDSSRERYFELYDLAPVGYCTISAEGLILETNLTAANLLGVTRNALVNQPINRFILKEDQDIFYLHRKQLLQIGGLRGCELRMVKNDRTVFWACMEASVTQVEGGAHLYRLVIFDISERKQTEMELVDANEQFRSLMQNSHGIIYTITPDGVVSYVSPSYIRLLGRDPSAILGMDFRSFIFPDDIAACEAFQREILRTGVMQKGLEYRVLHADGSIRWHLSNFTPCFNDKQEIVSFVGNAMDITEQKRYQVELDAARKTAEASEKVKSEFLALVSHEIRTPLNALVGFSALARKTIDPDILQQYLNIIDHSSHSLMDLVNDILDLSKIEAGQLSLEAIPFNLADTVDLIAWQYASLAAQKHLELRVTKNIPQPLWVCGDPTRIRQILANLITNAIKFTESGNVTLIVTTTASILDTCSLTVRLEVRDTGIGIATDKLNVLFQPFRQVDPSISRKFGGTGLGLAIVQSLVKVMNGRIEIISDEGQGSCFVVELPFAESVQPVYKKITTPVVAPLHILVVEDNAFNRRFLVDTLTISGHTVTQAENALQALELKMQSRYDLIILDVRMPEMDGIELTWRMRTLEKEQGLNPVPIIAYTADTEEATKEQCLAAGMQDVLFKPLDPDKLAMAINKKCKLRLMDGNRIFVESKPGRILVKRIHADMENNSDLIKQYIELLRDDIYHELDRMDEAIGTDDRQALRQATHSLKGLCSNLQDQSLRGLVLWLHNNALNSSLVELQNIAALLRSGLCTTCFESLIGE